MTPLFLLGAPKCATTSLYEHLARHPQLSAPSVKEPGYFSRSGIRPDVRARTPHVQSFDAYLALFDQRNDKIRAWCDGSPSYLRSPEALQAIRAKFPDARAIAVVRDPVDLVSSYYTFLRHERWENAPTLEEAWNAQEARREGVGIPDAARRPDSLVYADVAMLGSQVETAKRVFGASLLVFTVDDLRSDLQRVSRVIQEHAGLDPLDLGALPQSNPARQANSERLNALVKDPPEWLAKAASGLKARLGVTSLGIRRKVERANSTPVRRELAVETRDRLRAFFSADVALLSSILHRDLRAEWGWTDTA